MAQISEADAKTAAAAAAVELTLIIGDSVDTRCHGKLYDPTHPMRDFEKLFTFNKKTGVVASDDVYITAAYDNVTLRKKNPFDVVAKPTPVESTTTLEDADKSKIIITFDMVIADANIPAIGDFALVTDGTPTAISTITISGATVNLDCNADFANGDVTTIAYTPGAHPLQADIIGNDILAIAAYTVTNNIS